MVISLFLPWTRLVDTYNNQVDWGGYSPLGAFAYYPSLCQSQGSPAACGANFLLGFLIAQLPFFLALFWAVRSVWRNGSYLFTAVLGLISVGVWAFFAIIAANSEPIWTGGPYVGLYVAAAGSVFFVAARATEHEYPSKGPTNGYSLATLRARGLGPAIRSTSFVFIQR
jgi:hypothetical protein